MWVKPETGTLGSLILFGLLLLGADVSAETETRSAETGPRGSKAPKVSVQEPLAEPSKVRIEMPQTWEQQEVRIAAVVPADPLPTSVELAAVALPSETEQEKERAAAMRNLVEHWASAWSAQEVDTYLSFYSFDFAPDNGVDRADWAEQRRERLTRPEYIRVQVDFLSEPEEVSPGRYRMLIRQSYEADHYSDLVRKSIDLVQDGPGWKIFREEQLAIL